MVSWTFRQFIGFYGGRFCMNYDLFTLSSARKVLLCGTNIYPIPEYHVERVMSDHDLMYICEGTWQVAQDDIIYDLKAGDVILLRAGSHHWGTGLCSIGSKNMFLHFNHLPGDQLNTHLTAAECQSNASGNLFCVQTLTRCGMDSTMDQLFRSVIHVFWGHQDDKERRLTLLLHEILNELAFVARNSQPEAAAWITRLLNAMREQQDHFFSLSEAAGIAGMNDRTFSSRFRKMTGKSFHQYQMEAKLKTAYDALRTGRYTVQEVGQRLGFTDPCYFSRVFSRSFGVSPSEIRKGYTTDNVNRSKME